jgi:integrase
VPEFFTALRGQSGIAARALEITVLTALRTGEVIGATREEIDLDKKIWTIPIERSKDRKTRTKPHKVPLSPAVIALLKALPKVGQFLFPGLKAGKPLSNMAMAVALKELNKSESGGGAGWIKTAIGRSFHTGFGQRLGAGPSGAAKSGILSKSALAMR